MSFARSAVASLCIVAIGAPFAVLACGSDVAGPQPKLALSAKSAVPLVAPTVATPSSSAALLPAPTAALPAASSDATPALRWLNQLPPKLVTAKVDEMVWATVPTDAGVRMGIYRVLATHGTTASLQDVLRVRWDNVPGSLVLPIAFDAPFKVRLDQPVTYADWRGFVGIGVVTRAAPMLRVTFRDASDVVRDESANVAQPLSSEVAPLAWVMFPKSADAKTLHKGIVFAMAGESAFVRDDADRVFVVERSRAKPIPVPSRRLKKGEPVLAYAPDSGYVPGTIEREHLARLSYGVAIDGDVRTYFFSDLAMTESAAPAPSASAR